MLNDTLLENTLRANIIKVLNNRATKEDESQTPAEAINDVAKELASAITEAVSTYVKSAQVTIGPTNITVTSPAGPCVVTPTIPAKLQ